MIERGQGGASLPAVPKEMAAYIRGQCAQQKQHDQDTNGPLRALAHPGHWSGRGKFHTGSSRRPFDDARIGSTCDYEPFGLLKQQLNLR